MYKTSSGHASTTTRLKIKTTSPWQGKDLKTFIGSTTSTILLNHIFKSLLKDTYNLPDSYLQYLKLLLISANLSNAVPNLSKPGDTLLRQGEYLPCTYCTGCSVCYT